jgi:hypothetical protein
MEKNIYYVYVYLDPRKFGVFEYGSLKFDYEPFYVGKGTNKRMYAHLKTDKTNPHKTNKF